MNSKEEVRKALALSWALRAMGKSSHAGWGACMEKVAGPYGLDEDELKKCLELWPDFMEEDA